MRLRINRPALTIIGILIRLMGSAQTVPEELFIGDLQITINEGARKQIQGDVDRLTASKTYYDILVDRMNLYFPVVEQEFEKADVPEEIMFLSIQESGLISDAVSASNAVGFWQFKDFTAREMGLRVDRQIDERMHIRTASRGAAKYLNEHNFFYKNWQYAVTAYNTGRGTANKTYAKEAHFGTNKMTVSKGTHWYFKKFIAHVVAFSPSLGLPHSEELWLKEVTDTKGKTLAQIANEEKVELEELEKYNKWLKVAKIPSEKQYSVFVPQHGSPPKQAIAHKIGQTKKSKNRTVPSQVTKKYATEIAPGYSNADRASIIPLNGVPTVLAKAGDNVQSLSAKGGISEKKFRKYNDMGLDDKLIQNKFYYIRKKKGKAKIGFHVTRKEETLWDISQAYGIQMRKLAKKNHMSIADEVETGRILWLSKSRPSSTEIAYHRSSPPADSLTGKQNQLIVPSSNKRVTTPSTHDHVMPTGAVDSSAELRKVKIHTVAKGETLWAISNKYSVSIDNLLRWNELENANQINIGQNILVKAPIEEVSLGKNIVQYEVSPGDTLYGLSRKFDMTVDEIMELNKMSSSAIDVGQVLKVYDQ